MSQVDLGLASDVGKAASEPVVGAGDRLEDTNGKDDDPDSPPESFWLSKDAEFDWFDRNAFFERKESTKGMTPNLGNLNPAINNSGNSQRVPVSSNTKAMASMIGLPKTQKHSLDPKNRRNCKIGNTPLFPKQRGSVGKSGGPGRSMVEPSSPKVSCMGRVRSKRDYERRRRRNELPCDRKPGFLSGFRRLFRSGCRDCRSTTVHAPIAESPVRKSSAELMAYDTREGLPPPSEARDMSDHSVPRRSSVDGEPPGLGGMMRLTSGRRPDSWVQL